MPSRPRSFAGTAFILLTALLWSTGGAAIKYVPLDGLAVAALRCLIAGLVFLPFLRISRVTFNWRLAALLVSYPVMTTSFVLSNKWTTALNAVAIQYTAPLWIFIIGIITRTVKPSWKNLSPLAIVSVGIFLFLMEPSRGTSLQGNLTALISGIGFAGVIISYRLLRREDNYSLVCLSNLFSALILVPIAFLTGSAGAVFDLDLAGAAAMFYLGAFQIGLAYFLYSFGLRRVSALKASTVSLIEPVLAPIWTFLFLTEVPTVYGFFGAGAVLIGVTADMFLNPEQERTKISASAE